MSESPEDPDQPVASSVFDFLYYDARRIGAFLAQFGLPGVPQSVKQVTSLDNAQVEETAYRGQLGVPSVAHMANDERSNNTRTVRDSSEQTFDPVWVNGLSLLTLLDQRGLLSRDVASARIGQIAIVSGQLGVLDLGLMRSLYAAPGIRSLIEQGAAQAAAVNLEAAAGRRARHDAEKQAKQVVELLALLPHTVQAHIVRSDLLQVFAVLREDGLVGSSSDLMLKQGVMVPGVWHMLGVVDALPDGWVADSLDAATAEILIAGDSIGLAIAGLAPMVRKLGRPPSAFGMTPLLIFRQVELSPMKPEAE